MKPTVRVSRPRHERDTTIENEPQPQVPTAFPHFVSRTSPDRAVRNFKYTTDDIGNMDNNSVNETLLSRAKQGFRHPLQHFHRHILPHNWVGPGRSMPPKTRSGATATAPMSAPVITHCKQDSGTYHDYREIRTLRMALRTQAYRLSMPVRSALAVRGGGRYSVIRERFSILSS